MFLHCCQQHVPALLSNMFLHCCQQHVPALLSNMFRHCCQQHVPALLSNIFLHCCQQWSYFSVVNNKVHELQHAIEFKYQLKHAIEFLYVARNRAPVLLQAIVSLLLQAMEFFLLLKAIELRACCKQQSFFTVESNRALCLL